VELLAAEDVRRLVRAALNEDVGAGDVTSEATIALDAQARAQMVARQALTLAGVEIAEMVFAEISPDTRVTRRARDGQRLERGDVMLEVAGPARAILAGERVALNFLQRLSGVATLTAQYVEAVRGTGAQILDTRKTTPGLRSLEKYAVTCGGGKNHRMGLFDMVLIKDNHLAALSGEKPNAITAAVRRARRKYPHFKVEVEADTPEQVQQAVDAGADIILLDNMSIEQLRAAVHLVAGRAKTEASGGITLQSARAIAETGVDFLSVGALTHSATAVDIGLDFL
jgi:nicotinate-nucleotide pyrophosphorylase (carboxylating)